MEVISIIGAKGGLGKTCLAVNMANYLSNCGISTLLVDCDFNTNGATNFMELNGLEVNTQSAFKSLEVLLSRPFGNEFELELKKPEAEIKDDFWFVPTTVKGEEETIRQFNSEDLKKQYSQIGSVFEQWRKKYQVIILDHAGGYTDLVNFLLSFSSKILLINTDTISGIKSSRSLYKKLAITNQEIVQCINRIDNKTTKESEGIIKKCYGFEERSLYKDTLSKGAFLQLDLPNMEVLKHILITLLPVYSNDIEELHRQEMLCVQKLQDEEAKAELLSKYKRILRGCLILSLLISWIFIEVAPSYRLPLIMYMTFMSSTELLLCFIFCIIICMLVLPGLFALIFLDDISGFWKFCKCYLTAPIRLIFHVILTPNPLADEYEYDDDEYDDEYDDLEGSNQEETNED